jgi:hypothetical protein
VSRLKVRWRMCCMWCCTSGMFMPRRWGEAWYSLSRSPEAHTGHSKAARQHYGDIRRYVKC